MATAPVTASRGRNARLIDDAIVDIEATKRLEFIEACRRCVTSSLRPSDRDVQWLGRADWVCIEMNNYTLYSVSASSQHLGEATHAAVDCMLQRFDESCLRSLANRIISTVCPRGAQTLSAELSRSKIKAKHHQNLITPKVHLSSYEPT